MCVRGIYLPVIYMCVRGIYLPVIYMCVRGIYLPVIYMCVRGIYLASVYTIFLIDIFNCSGRAVFCVCHQRHLLL